MNTLVREGGKEGWKEAYRGRDGWKRGEAKLDRTGKREEMRKEN